MLKHLIINLENISFHISAVDRNQSLDCSFLLNCKIGTFILVKIKILNNLCAKETCGLVLILLNICFSLHRMCSTLSYGFTEL